MIRIFGRRKMSIYYLMVEARPCADNDESKEFEGAFINCWVKAKDQRSAIDSAKNYIDSEGWETIRIEEVGLSCRDNYENEPDLLSCYDSACKYGISAIFNTWEPEEDV